MKYLFLKFLLTIPATVPFVPKALTGCAGSCLELSLMLWVYRFDPCEVVGQLGREHTHPLTVLCLGDGGAICLTVPGLGWRASKRR